MDAGQQHTARARHARLAALLIAACAASSQTACQKLPASQNQRQALPPEPAPASNATNGRAADAKCMPQASTDWLSQMPGQQRLILPLPCERMSDTPLFSWGEPPDRDASIPWSFTLREAGGVAVVSRSDIAVPRLVVDKALQPGDYEWSVSFTTKRGAQVTSQWRRFSIEASTASALRAAGSETATPARARPATQTVVASVMAKVRPRALPAGASFAGIAAAAQAADHLPVFNALKASANQALRQPVPAAPQALQAGSDLDKLRQLRSTVHLAAAERARMEVSALIGRIENNTALLSSARERLLALAAWSPTGPSSEAGSDQANREIYLALAIGLDLLWPDLDAAERTQITTSLRARVLQASKALGYVDRSPYDSHGITNVRLITQALLLAAGLPGFPEAPAMLASLWDLGRFTSAAWSDKDGGFGNGIAYAWYSFNTAVPHVAAVRAITGVDLYQLPALRQAGAQLIAFTAPNHNQPSAFGDEAETQDLYANYASNFYRLHAQMTHDPVDAWYWQVNAARVNRPAPQSIWQLLLLGVDPRPLAKPQAPTRHSWFFPGAGLAAMHVDAAASARTSVFFRSSRFGAFNHSHADQNSLVLVSLGQPLLINAGYYPYYDSPHHKLVTRATRYKNALTFDGGIGQSEREPNPTRPTEPLHSMDASGTLIRAETQGSLSVVTGDATAAYRGYDSQAQRWVPLLGDAVRSVVMDRANGITLVYDWATSAVPRRWELNYHSPNAFVVDGTTVKATNGEASVCLDRHGPPSSFEQTSAWDVPPEVNLPAQAHGRFSLRTASNELVHLTVLRDGCQPRQVQVKQTGTSVQVSIGSQVVSFDKRLVQANP